MKRIATRGLLILILVVACSMFFAQTIITITTPKVKLVTARKGRFEEKIALTGKVSFEKTMEYTPDGMEGQTITINRVLVRTGDYVEAGQPIAEATISSDFEAKIEEARDGLQSAQSDFRKNEFENTNFTDNTDSDKNNAIRAAETALNTLMDAQEALVAAATEKGIVLGTDTSTWAATIQRSGDSTLISLMGTVIDAQTLVNEAEAEVVKIFKKSRTKKELFEYIEERVGYQRAVNDKQEALIALMEQAESLKTICAPHSGYITELNLEAGKTYDGSKAAVVFSMDCEPAIQCDVSDTSRTFEVGMRADIQSDLGDVQSEILSVVNKGTKTTDIFVGLEKDTLPQFGGLHAMMDAKLPVTVIYKSKQTTTLLSASAVRTEAGDKSFVYVVEQANGFWGITMTVRKQQVTVLERGEADISLLEDLAGVQIADKEDRAIEDGTTVMEYVN